MKYKNLFWGVVLILLGVLYLLKKFDVIWFNWRDIVALWPLILILWGVSLLPIKALYKLFASFLAIIIMLSLIYFNPGKWHSGWFWIGDFVKKESAEINQSESIHENSEYAKLELTAAAGTYIVAGVTEELVDFKHVGDSGTYYMRTTVEDNRHKVHIGPESHHNQFVMYRSHKVEISLNSDLVWDLDLDAGAADIELDLSPFLIDDLKIQGGATSMEIILGDRSDDVFVDIETGVSSVLIKVPKEVACEVKTNSFLVSKDLPGFDKVSKSTYVSPNFSSSTKNITIRFESGISSFRVLRY
ncbi:MAG: DUF5668 domain-containing protein [Bacteroidota bacterium]